MHTFYITEIYTQAQVDTKKSLKDLSTEFYSYTSRLKYPNSDHTVHKFRYSGSLRTDKRHQPMIKVLSTFFSLSVMAQNSLFGDLEIERLDTEYGLDLLSEVGFGSDRTSLDLGEQRFTGSGVPIIAAQTELMGFHFLPEGLRAKAKIRGIYFDARLDREKNFLIIQVILELEKDQLGIYFWLMKFDSATEACLLNLGFIQSLLERLSGLASGESTSLLLRNFTTNLLRHTFTINFNFNYKTQLLAES